MVTEGRAGFARKLIMLSVVLTLFLSVYYPLPYGVSLRIALYIAPFVLVGLILVLTVGVKRSSFPVNLFPLLVLLSTFVLYLLLYTLIGGEGLSNHGPVSFLFIFVFSLILALLVITFDLERFFLIVYLVVSFIVCLNITYNYVFVEHYYWARTSIKVGEVLRDPNYVGAYIAASPSVFYILYFSDKAKVSKLAKILGVTFLILAASSVVALGSRSVLVSAVVPFLVLYLYSQYKARSIKSILILPSALLVLMMMPILFSEARFFKKEQSEMVDLGIRSDIWSGAIELYFQRPIFGYGLSVDASDFTLGYATHNVYIDIALFGGLLGVVLFLTYVFAIILFASKQRILMSIMLLPLFLPIASINGFMTFAFWLPIIMSLVLYGYLNKRPKNYSSRVRLIN